MATVVAVAGVEDPNEKPGAAEEKAPPVEAAGWPNEKLDAVVAGVALAA